jgi:N utilization substance protein A
MNADLIRFVDSISRDKAIEKESIFVDLEAAILSAIRKANGEEAEIDVGIDRITGTIAATVDGKAVNMAALGRIAAQTGKQVLIQRVREDERNSIFDEYSQRVGTVVTGTVIRYEGGALIVNLGRGEGILPRSEQIPGEMHHPGERVRAMILDVREEKNQVRIVLTQTHPDYIKRLFELEVPEVGERIIEIRALAREAGYRTKVAVTSIDAKVDAVGACVGVRGSRIRNIVDELGGEKIDIVRWNESSQILISNALKPAEVQETFLCFELGRATVIVAEDQLSLAIGKRGQNVRLAARLTGWDIDILTPEEYNKGLDHMEKGLKKIEGVEDVLLDKLLAIGVISLHDLVDVGTEPLVTTMELEESLAATIVAESARMAAEIDAASEAAKKLAAQQAAEAAARKAAGEVDATDEADGAEATGEDQPTGESVDDAVDEAIDDTVAEAVEGPIDGAIAEGEVADEASGSADEDDSRQAVGEETS